MKEGNIFAMKDFYVVPNNMKIKTTDSNYKLIISFNTRFFEIYDHSFAVYMYNLKTFDEVFAIEYVGRMPLFGKFLTLL